MAEIIENLITDEAANTMTMDEFLSLAVKLYPETADMDFLSAIETVVNSTDNKQLLDNYIETQGNLLEFLYVLSTSLPTS